MKRRTFIQSATAATAMLSLPVWARQMAAKKIGIQLYTLKDVIDQDPKGILKKLASFGYRELETFGYKDGKLFGLTNTEFGNEVKSLGMQVVSGHYGIDLVRADTWEKTVADAKALGQTNIVVPWLAEPERTPEKIKVVCEDINKAAEVTKKYGIRMGYHNHDFEFKEVNGEPMFDLMLKELDPKLVDIEMDIYWVVFAGHDPLAYFEKYPGRFTQWHVKDMDKEARNKNTEVGNGAIDWKPIFAKAKRSGMKHFYVEQESFTMPSIESAKICIENLQKII